MANKSKKIQELAKKCVDHLSKEAELLAELLSTIDSSELPIQQTPSLTINELNFQDRCTTIHMNRGTIKDEIAQLRDEKISSIADVAKLVDPGLKQQLQSISRRIFKLTQSVEATQNRHTFSA